MKMKKSTPVMIACVSIMLLSTAALVSASTPQQVLNKPAEHTVPFNFMPWVCQFCGDYNHSVSTIVKHHKQFTSLSYEQYYLGTANYSFSRFGLTSPKLLAVKYGLPVFPMIVSSDKAAMHVLFTNSTVQMKFISEAVKTAEMKGYAGYNMDFEVPYNYDSTVLTGFIANFSSALDKSGFSLSVDLPGTAVLQHFSPTSYGGAYNWSAIAKTGVTKLIVMDYVSIGDYEQIVNYSVANIPLNKLSIALPDYGFGFLVNTTISAPFPYNIIKTVGAHMYGQVRTIVHNAFLLHARVTKHFSTFYGEAYYSIVYPGEKGTAYEYYYINSHAMTLRLSYLKQLGIRGIAMWRLGAVDSSIWGPIQSYASSATWVAAAQVIIAPARDE